MNILKKVENVLNDILISILILILLIIGMIVIQTIVNPNKVPTFFGYKTFVITSDSMKGEINKGDLVIVKVSNYDNLKENDIISYKLSSDYVVTHRIVDIDNSGDIIKYYTKGDNNELLDTKSVIASNIEGKFSFKISKMGNLLLTLEKPSFYITALIIICGLIVLVLLTDKYSKTNDLIDSKIDNQEYEINDDFNKVNNEIVLNNENVEELKELALELLRQTKENEK